MLHASYVRPNVLLNMYMQDRRYNLMRINVSSSVKCFEVCPNSSPSDVTWCIYIYHPTEYVSLCLNTTGVIYETYVAALLLLERNFVVKQVGTSSNAMIFICLHVGGCFFILLHMYNVIHIYVYKSATGHRHIRLAFGQSKRLTI